MSKPNEVEVRTEVSAWLKENWDPNLGLVEWREKLIETAVEQDDDLMEQYLVKLVQILR